MSRQISHLDFSLVCKIVIPFFVVFFVIFSINGLSEELSPNQKEFSDSIESYNKLRAQQIAQQAKYEEQSQQAQ